jgi:NAD(P)-dependent dehydrogenase (short-subunit alcohol dehydrogenase family)
MSKMNQNARVSLVTGGTEGIGRAVAVELARRGGRGDRIILVGRDRERGERVLAELRAIGPNDNHVFFPADLSLLSETSRLARALEGQRLDAVVCCAGILSTIPEWTSEGLERSFVLNYLSRYLLVRRLLPALERSPSGRVVLVANAGVYKDRIDLADLQYRKGKAGLEVSARTQVAIDLLATELADRVRATRIEVTCVFPGVVRTRVFENARGLPWFFRLLAPVVRLFAQCPEAAADTPAFLAQDPLAVGTNGRFYGPRRVPRKVPRPVQRPDRKEGLWVASEQLVRTYLPPADRACDNHDTLERVAS